MNEIPNQIDDTAYGIISQAPDKLGATKLLYTACMEVNDLSVKQLPEGMNSICLPSQQYAEFKHQGFVDIENVNQTINYIYSIKFRRFHYLLCNPGRIYQLISLLID